MCSENLTRRLRIKLFERILNRKLAWFDRPENGTSVLCARLSADTAAINGAIGTPLASVAQGGSAFIAMLFISVYSCWKLGMIVMLLLLPVILLTVHFSTIVFNYINESNRNATRQSSKVIAVAQEIRCVCVRN